MNAKEFVDRLTDMSQREEAMRFPLPNIVRGNFNESVVETGHSIASSVLNAISGVSGIGNSVGGTPYTIGDPVPMTTSTGTGTFPSIVPMPSVFPNALDSAYSYSNIVSGLMPTAMEAFLNITYLQAEATCAVTGRKIERGEPVLILFEHIISKEAFQKMLVRQLESMMVPKEEEMHENYDYNN